MGPTAPYFAEDNCGRSTNKRIAVVVLIATPGSSPSSRFPSAAKTGAIEVPTTTSVELSVAIARRKFIATAYASANLNKSLVSNSNK